MNNWNAFEILRLLTDNNYRKLSCDLEGRNGDSVYEICIRSHYVGRPYMMGAPPTRLSVGLYCIVGNYLDRTVQVSRDYVPVGNVNKCLLKLIGKIHQIDYRILYYYSYVGCSLNGYEDKYYFRKHEKTYELNVCDVSCPQLRVIDNIGDLDFWNILEHFNTLEDDPSLLRDASLCEYADFTRVISQLNTKSSRK